MKIAAIVDVDKHLQHCSSTGLKSAVDQHRTVDISPRSQPAFECLHVFRSKRW